MRLAELQKRRYFHPELALKFARKSSATQFASSQSRWFTFSNFPREDMSKQRRDTIFTNPLRPLSPIIFRFEPPYATARPAISHSGRIG